MNDTLKKEVLYHIQRLAALSSQIADEKSSSVPVFRLSQKAYESGWIEGLKQAAAIARKYEPDEKSDLVSYASLEIEATLKASPPMFESTDIKL